MNRTERSVGTAAKAKARARMLSARMVPESTRERNIVQRHRTAQAIARVYAATRTSA